MKEFSDIQAQLTQHPLEITVRRLANDLSYGEDNSTYVGSGIEYAQSRQFVDGDPVKDIDWRVTARTGRFHVKEYEALKRMPVYLLVDTSASMCFSSGRATKHQLAVLIAGALGLAALSRQSPVGTLGAGERSILFAPSLLRNRIFQWLHELGNNGYAEKTYLTERLDQAGELLKSRSLVIAISDFHDPDAVVAMKRIAQRHDLVALQLQDPAERGRLKGGLFRGREAETGRAFVAHGRSRWLEGDVGAELRAAGIDHLLLRTEKSFVTPLRHFLKERGILGRNSR